MHRPEYRLTPKWLALLSLLGGAAILHAQAGTTASRPGDAQIGISYVRANPDYVLTTYQGIGAYADFDFTPHLGAEAEFHRVDSPTNDQSYEQTFEIGARYHRTYGPLVPYVKGMIGRGIFNYPYNGASLGYTMYAGGGGIDVKVGEFVRVRGEYEYQKWSGFQNGGLAPQLVTIGVAYHFDGRFRYGH
jgi:opacity protein-like surface antigen